MPKTQHTVTITVANGVFTYSTVNKEVRSGAELRWICNKDFAIVFEQKKSPFTPKLISLSEQANTYTAYYTIKKATTRIHHKYAVAAYVGGTPPILTDDPQIIIDNTPGSGGGGGKAATKKKPRKKPK